jgi:hypothetical protein
MSNSVEELVFALAEERTSGDLEKLIRLLDLVLNGKKNLEAQEVPAPAPAQVVASKTTKAAAKDDESF